MDLFEDKNRNNNKSFDLNYSRPLAYRMRPLKLEDFCGQTHILGANKPLRVLIENQKLKSAIFYGPPGTGKTSLATLIAKAINSSFKSLNAVDANSADLRKVITQAKDLLNFNGVKTILFVDEIHRFNKAQQDILMPEVENGNLILIGATTHNPFFSVNGPLLSRAMLFELKELKPSELLVILKRALSDKENGYGAFNVKYEESVLELIASRAGGDARKALNILESALEALMKNNSVNLTLEDMTQYCQSAHFTYDSHEDAHYDTISAFIKSMRGSDPDASIYWLARMILGGEDPLFIARRILIFASEDIGNAEPNALILASSMLNALQMVGMPEGRIILAQTVTYMATAPKSNASYLAIDAAMEDVKSKPLDKVPDYLKGTKSAVKILGNAGEYQYPHDFKDAFVKQDYFSNGRKYYNPTERGFEATIKERMAKRKQE